MTELGVLAVEHVWHHAEFWTALLQVFLTVGGWAAAFQMLRWQLARQKVTDAQAGADSSRKAAYEQLLVSMIWVYDRAHLLRTQSRLIGPADGLRKLLGLFPPRDLLDLDRAVQPAQQALFAAVTSVRVHAGGEGGKDADAVLVWIRELMDCSTRRSREWHRLSHLWRRLLQGDDAREDEQWRLLAARYRELRDHLERRVSAESPAVPSESRCTA